MPITKSAKKALRQSLRKRERNLDRKKGLQKVLKVFTGLVKAKKADEAKNYFASVQKALDKAVKTGLLKKNTASRKKSRLSKLLKKSS